MEKYIFNIWRYLELSSPTPFACLCLFIHSGDNKLYIFFIVCKIQNRAHLIRGFAERFIFHITRLKFQSKFGSAGLDVLYQAAIVRIPKQQPELILLIINV